MKRELLFIGIILLIFYAINGFPTDIHSILGDATIDLNVHDTYFVISKKYYWMYTLLFIFSIAYLIRILITKFRYRFANYAYLIINALLIVWLIIEIRVLNIFLRESKQQKILIDDLFYNFFYFITAAFIFAVIFEIYVLFKVFSREKRTGL